MLKTDPQAPALVNTALPTGRRIPIDALFAHHRESAIASICAARDIHSNALKIMSPGDLEEIWRRQPGMAFSASMMRHRATDEDSARIYAPFYPPRPHGEDRYCPGRRKTLFLFPQRVKRFAMTTPTPDAPAKEGDYIELIEMGADPVSGRTDPCPVPPGTRGRVIGLCPWGTSWQIAVAWEAQRTLALVWPVDRFHIIGKGDAGDARSPAAS